MFNENNLLPLVAAASSFSSEDAYMSFARKAQYIDSHAHETHIQNEKFAMDIWKGTHATEKNFMDFTGLSRSDFRRKYAIALEDVENFSPDAKLMLAQIVGMVDVFPSWDEPEETKSSNLTVKEMAKRLNGRQYLEEMSPEEGYLARDNRIVIVYGYSDDNIEFNGAIYDELSCFNGGEFWIDTDGTIYGYGDQENIPATAKKLEALWCADNVEAPWSYRTSIPHETFNIYEDDELFCIGIVFSMEDLK